MCNFIFTVTTYPSRNSPDNAIFPPNRRKWRRLYSLKSWLFAFNKPLNRVKRYLGESRRVSRALQYNCFGIMTTTRNPELNKHFLGPAKHVLQRRHHLHRCIEIGDVSMSLSRASLKIVNQNKLWKSPRITRLVPISLLATWLILAMCV
jgi:hypothetical protein